MDTDFHTAVYYQLDRSNQGDTPHHTLCLKAESHYSANKHGLKWAILWTVLVIVKLQEAIRLLSIFLSRT